MKTLINNILIFFSSLLIILVSACTGGENSQQMHEALMKAKAQNENFEPFTSDSTMLRVVDYYDSHGSDNERMLAHYLLGCVYRDLGDAPRALECYYDAVSKADTTDADCDFQRLSRIYGQMADLFYNQRSPQFEKEAELNAIRMAWKAKDTLAALNFYAHLAGVYELMGDKDSAFIISKYTCNLLEMYDLHEHKYGFLHIQFGHLLEKQEYDKAKLLMNDFETKSNLWVTCKNVCFLKKNVTFVSSKIKVIQWNNIDSWPNASSRKKY